MHVGPQHFDDLQSSQACPGFLREVAVDALLPFCSMVVTVLNCISWLQRTALHVGARKGHVDVVKKLLACGADPNICGEASQFGSGITVGADYCIIFGT